VEVDAVIGLARFSSIRGIGKSLQQIGERHAVLRVGALFITMPAVIDDFLAACVNVAHRRFAMLAEYDT
jgi:hypothetical protein